MCSVEYSVERNVKCSVEKSRVYLCYMLLEDGTCVPKHVGVFCVTHIMSLRAFVGKYIDCRNINTVERHTINTGNTMAFVLIC
jgi:hypothetical protein